MMIFCQYLREGTYSALVPIPGNSFSLCSRFLSISISISLSLSLSISISISISLSISLSHTFVTLQVRDSSKPVGKSLHEGNSTKKGHVKYAKITLKGERGLFSWHHICCERNANIIWVRFGTTHFLEPLFKLISPRLTGGSPRLST